MSKRNRASLEDLEQQRLKRMVASRHPTHKVMSSEWEFFRKALEGGPNYAEGNLFKHPKEDPAIYAERKRRASDNHFNVSQLVMDTYVGYIFQNMPTMAAEIPEELKRYIGKADEEGRPLTSLAKDVLYWMGTYGIIWVATDKPQAPIDPALMTAAQELEHDLFPYSYVVHPTHMLDGKIVRGEAVWCLVKEDVRDDGDPWSMTGKVTSQYRLWEKDQWTVIQVKKDQYGRDVFTTDTQPNPLGAVPFVPFRFSEGCGFSAKGLLGDIAHLDRAIFNKSSLLDEIHYAATFPQLAIPFEGQLIDQMTGGLTAEGKMVLTMGLHTVIPFNYQAGPPQYVSPDSGPANVLEMNIQTLVQMALALALLDGEVAKDGHTKTASSGVSKAYVFEKLNRRLATIADILEKGFQKVFEMVARWQSLDPASLPPTVWAFPDNYEVRSLAQDIADTIAMIGTGIPSDTFKKHVFKALVRKAYPKMDEKLMVAIEAEIEAFDFEAAALEYKENMDEDPDMADEDPDEDEETSEKGVGKRQAPGGTGNRIGKKGLDK